MIDENVYRKEGRRYVPFGRVVNMDYFNDGIWYIRHRPSVKSYTNMEYLTGVYRVCGAKDLSIDVLAGMENIANDIAHSSEMVNLTSKGYSVMDIIRLTITQIINRQQPKK
nr:MAG TPA: hypothetical protein [Bacteriophage sp.]